jgi:hypothetical protein
MERLSPGTIDCLGLSFELLSLSLSFHEDAEYMAPVSDLEMP